MDMQKMLGKKVEDAITEPMLPSGLWKLLVLGFKTTKSSKKGTDGVEFSFRAVEPGTDVDPTELGQWQDQMKTGNFDQNAVKRQDSFWITEHPYTLVQLRKFIEATGVNITGRTFEECIPDTQGRQLWGVIGREPVDGKPGEFREKIQGYHAL